VIVRHTIEHEVDYTYSARVHSSVMTLYLRPIQDRRQQVLDFGIETEPSGPLFGFVGPFGNKGHFLDRPSPHERLAIRSRATVEVGPVAPVPDRLGSGAWRHLGKGIRSPELWLMLQPSRFVRSSPELDRFVAERKIERGDDPLQSAIELCSRLHDIFEYTPGSTAVDSPIERILKTGRGVCQDYAHVMASIMRSWGVPCRHVSGYLGPDASLAAPGQCHAWVECWYPELGWTGIDPANNSPADHRHVRVAVGRDYADVPPSRGVYRGAADSTLKTRVTVTRHQEPAGESPEPSAR
jgi:transglutaminase-like putative cysteine protease